MKKIALFFVVLVSCTAVTNKKKPEQNQPVIKQDVPVERESVKSYVSLDFAKSSKNVLDTSLFNLVDHQCAVIIYPDSAWLQKQKKETKEEDWNEIVADHDYYNYEANRTLDTNGIEVKYYKIQKPYYKFILNDKSEFIVDNSKMADKWRLILFNTDQKPVFWNSTKIEDALKEIYKK